MKSLIKIILLFTICLAVSLIFAFPLWLWASKSGSSFSLTVLIAASLCVIYLITKKIIKTVSKK